MFTVEFATSHVRACFELVWCACFNFFYAFAMLLLIVVASTKLFSCFLLFALVLSFVS